MKKSFLVLVLCVSILNLVLPTTSVSAKSVGKGCSKAGVIAGTKKNPLVCKKVGNKLVWQRFVTASPSSLVPVSTTTIPISTTTVPSRNNCIVGGACKIGDIGPGGGTVFFDAGSLQSWGRYLEAAQKDLAVAQWDDAMAAAQAYETVGTSDWRLPTIDEIKLMFGQSQVIGNFVRSGNYQRYWTSSDVGESAWRLSMFDGSLQLRLKFFEGYWSSSVRPIRSF